MKLLKTICFLFIAGTAFGQVAPNFSVTDTDGNVQKLYENYLNIGKVVVLKIFFVNCPPCNAIAPSVQQKYIAWGAGQQNVQFIELTNKVTDTDPLVIGYKTQHGITFPSVSATGGSVAAAQPYMSGNFGQWSGTPCFIVIAPNGTVNFDVNFSDLDAAITAAGGVLNAPTTVKFNVNFKKPIPSSVAFSLHPDGQTSPSVPLTFTDNALQFSIPSANIPEMVNPVITMTPPAIVETNGITVSDVIVYVRHILGSQKMTNEQLLAADVNGDGKINAQDVVLVRRLILKSTNTLPNGVPTYKMIPSVITVPIANGTTQTLNASMYQMGNVD